MNRSDLQRLAELRLNDARVLFEAGAFSASYYLAGYSIECALKACFATQAFSAHSIECALKACVAKQVKEFDFPDKRLAERSYTHNLRQLLDVAGIEAELKAAMAENEKLEGYWFLVSKWSEQSRYTVDTLEKSAQDMLAAVGETPDGVLSWLKKFW